MANVCVDSMTIRLTANNGWGWGKPTNLGNSKDFTVSSSGKKITTNGTKNVVIASDITTAMTAITGEEYHAAAFGSHAGGSNGTLAIVTLLTGLVVSAILKNAGNGVALDNMSGNFQIGLLVPATNGVPTNDPGVPVGFHTGTWTVQNHGQSPLRLTAS